MTSQLTVIASSHATGWSPALLLAIFVGGAAVVIGGLLCWRGKEVPMVISHQRVHGPRSTPLAQGGLRLYKTVFGSGFTLIPAGTGFMLIPLAEALRSALGHHPNGAVLSISSYIGVSLVLISLMWSAVYSFLGVPDWMRPPAQRGWELTKEGYVLARPEARVIDDLDREIEAPKKQMENRSLEGQSLEPDPWATGDDPWKEHDPWA